MLLLRLVSACRRCCSRPLPLATSPPLLARSASCWCPRPPASASPCRWGRQPQHSCKHTVLVLSFCAAPMCRLMECKRVLVGLSHPVLQVTASPSAASGGSALCPSKPPMTDPEPSVAASSPGKTKPTAAPDAAEEAKATAPEATGERLRGLHVLTPCSKQTVMYSSGCQSLAAVPAGTAHVKAESNLAASKPNITCAACCVQLCRCAGPHLHGQPQHAFVLCPHTSNACPAQCVLVHRTHGGRRRQHAGPGARHRDVGRG